MNYLKIFMILLVTACLLTNCKQPEEARKPISRASGSFMKESIERNKKLVATEEDQIRAIIKKNPKITYLASKKGYWYYYDVQNTTDTISPKKGDVAFFTYEIKDLKGNIIYSELELRPQTYYVDKENIMTGLRDGIKLMHKKEKVNFLFPSHIGFGYHGDNKKIGTNQPIVVTVNLSNFVSETTYKKYTQAKKPTEVATTPVPPSTDSPLNDTIQ